MFLSDQLVGEHASGHQWEFVTASVLSGSACKICSGQRRRRGGGCNGAHGSAHLSGGKTLAGKGTQEIPAGQRLILNTPGGGGFGPVS
jgi:N-methylhydantoinase B/oxoprolinase/acetone carboxylase alpha subunit